MNVLGPPEDAHVQLRRITQDLLDRYVKLPSIAVQWFDESPMLAWADESRKAHALITGIRRALFVARDDETTIESRFAHMWVGALTPLSSVERIALVDEVFEMATSLAFELVAFACSPEDIDLRSWLAAAANKARSAPLRPQNIRVIQIESWTSWFGSAIHVDLDWSTLRPIRDGRLHSRVWVAVERRFVSAESRLEREFLDAVNFTDQIRRLKEQPVAIAYVRDGRALRYTPDFVIQTSVGVVLVEVKHVSKWTDPGNIAKWDGAAVFCRDRGWGFMVTDGWTSPREVVRIADASVNDGYAVDNSASPLQAALDALPGPLHLRNIESERLLRNLFDLPRGKSPWLDSLR